MKKYLFVAIALWVLTGMLAFGAGSQEKAGKSWQSEKLAMKVEALGWILQKHNLEEFAKKFMSDHPNITVEVTSNPDVQLNNYMLNWSTGDINVDLAFGGPAARVGKLAFKELLEPWNDFYTGDLDRKNLLTHVVELPKRGNEYYAFPFMAEGMSLQANKKLMIEAGLGSAGAVQNPKTLEDLYTFAKKMTKGTAEVKDVYGFSWNFSNFEDQQLFCAVNSLGGKSYNADGTPNLTDPKIVDIFTFVKRVTMDGYGTKGTITDTNAGRNGYMARTVAMIFEAASRAIEAKPKIGDEAIVLPFPGMDDRGSFIYSHYCYIPKGTKVKDVVWAFMREQITGKEFAKFGAEKFGKLPTLKRNYEGLGADFTEITKWMSNPNAIGDLPWVEGSKLLALIDEIEQSLVTSDLTPAAAATKLAQEGAKLNLSVVK
ncbi:MAG TPA: extracellular solute-binding protein [Spirochaetia bacterium]|nr:extracellular solute-binding protein [Spirochaetia bacterium]